MSRKRGRGPRDRESQDNQSRTGYLGRILLGFIVLAAILWILSFIF